LFFISFINLFAQDYLEVKPQKGDGLITLLKKYGLPTDSDYIKLFLKLNAKKVDKNNQIFTHLKYKMPILLLTFDGTTIRSSLSIDDYDLAKKIQDYNLFAVSKKLKKQSYQTDYILWVPFSYLENIKNKDKVVKKKESDKLEGKTKTAGAKEKVKLNEKHNYKFNTKLFGPSYKKVKHLDDLLTGCVFYLDPGHGGPDPGAIGYKDGKELTEDEYAYDVTLRLAHNLLEHNATVFMVIIDSTDGIRDEQYLKNNTDEYFGTGKLITGDQKERLQGRIDYINSLTSKFPEKKQRLIVIHVDSRETEQRIDVFFYHKPGDSLSKKYAETLMETLERKYNNSQPGRGYSGNVTDRNLYMLRRSPVISVYIELGNLQNPQDQLRFINKNNRQAIANWLCEGILHNERHISISKKSKLILKQPIKVKKNTKRDKK
jgi:N-acetylmuramoyl-L-alanine amidase